MGSEERTVADFMEKLTTDDNFAQRWEELKNKRADRKDILTRPPWSFQRDDVEVLLGMNRQELTDAIERKRPGKTVLLYRFIK